MREELKQATDAFTTDTSDILGESLNNTDSVINNTIHETQPEVVHDNGLIPATNKELGRTAITEIGPLNESSTGRSLHDILMIARGEAEAEGVLTEGDAVFLIKANLIPPVIDNAHKFAPLGPRTFNLLATMNSAPLRNARFFHAFKGLGMSEANRLIQLDILDTIIACFDSFGGITKVEHLTLACNMITHNGSSFVYRYLEKFTGITPREHIVLARKSVEVGYTSMLAMYFERLTGIDPKDHAELVFGSINSDGVEFIVGNLQRFNGLTEQNRSDVASKIIDAGKEHILADNINQFDGLTIDDLYGLADRLIDSGRSGILAMNIDKFTFFSESDHLNYARKILDNSPKGTFTVASNISKFRGLDRDIALALIEARFGGVVMEHITDSFTALTSADYTTVVYALIDKHQMINPSLFRNIGRYVHVDQREIVDRMIDKGHSGTVLQMYEYFNELSVFDDVELFEKMLAEDDYSRYVNGSLVASADKFSGLMPEDYVRAAEEEIARRGVRRVIQNIAKLPGLDHARIVDLARQEGLCGVLITHASQLSVELPAEVYANANLVKLEGFDQRWLGEFIKTRLNTGTDSSVHNATYWLNIFTIRDSQYDIEAIKGLAGTATLLPPKVRMDHPSAEKEFFVSLAASSLEVRQQLNFGDAKRALSDEDALKLLFARDKSIQSAYYRELQQSQSELTQQYYSELLEDQATGDYWHECERSGMKLRRFFALLFKERPELDRVLKSRISHIRTELTNNYLTKYQAEVESASFDTRPVAGEEWFDTSNNRLRYRVMLRKDVNGVPLYKTSGFTYDVLNLAALNELERNMGHKHITKQLTELIQFYPDRPFSDVVRDLQETQANRARYVHDAQTWLQRHATTKSSQIVAAWADRPLALARGVPDGVSHILRWAKDNALNETLDSLESRGALLTEYGFTRAEFMSDEMEPVRSELMSVLSAKHTLQAVAKLKKWHEKRGGNPEQRIPAVKQSVIVNSGGENLGYTFEILSKDDPRGCTIGENTHCCMTIGGVSESCIKAGYTQENAGFMAVYRGDLLVAQSFWYVHPDRPETLLIDNIETNKGRDLHPIMQVYQQALKQILTDNPEIGIAQVNIGVRYSGVDLEGLEDTKSVPKLEDVYSDAKHQKLLLTLDS